MQATLGQPASRAKSVSLDLQVLLASLAQTDQPDHLEPLDCLDNPDSRVTVVNQGPLVRLESRALSVHPVILVSKVSLALSVLQGSKVSLE